MGKIRILHIIGQLGVGGSETQLLETCRRMDRERFDLSVCWYGRMPVELTEEFRAIGVPTVFFDKFAMPPWRFFRKLRQTIREIQPDIVHTWLYSANSWGRWAAVSCRVAHIVASDRGEVQRAGLVIRLSERLLAHRTLRMANSQAIARTLDDRLGLPASSVKIVYNGTSPNEVPREDARSAIRDELGFSSEARIVLMVGRLLWMKNYEMFVRAARRVCQARNDVMFVSAGDGEDKPKLIRQAQEAGIQDRIRFLGLRRDVPRLLAGADVFCFTSQTEGFPNSVLEAMMAGLPVVCTDFPAAFELITSPDVGLIVRRDDDAAMADEVIRLLDDPERRKQLGIAAQALVTKRHSWDVLVKTMEDLYEGLVAGDLGGACLDRQPV